MKTRITELLGIKYPIIQSAMIGVAYSPLVAAVSNAGGLGLLGSAAMPPEELRRNIREIRELTDKPFGANVTPQWPHYKQLVDVMVEEKVPVVSHGLGNPVEVLRKVKAAGMILIASVGTARQAVRAERDGADAVIVTGTEAGAHTSYISTLVLIPKAVDGVKIPVIAAGGFCDGKGLVTALSLGAEGIAMGTRFAMTQESSLHPNTKQWMLEADEGDPIASTSLDPLHLRAIWGEKLKRYWGWKWWARPWRVFPESLTTTKLSGISLREGIRMALKTKRISRMSLSEMIQFHTRGAFAYTGAVFRGDRKWGAAPCGQVVGRINDLPTCREVIERIVAEAEQIIESTRAKLSLS